MKGATRVGDGPLWVLITLALLLAGDLEGLAGRQLALGLIVNVLLYKLIKTRFGRPRPFQQILVVEQRANVPDEFSFPSGHMAAASVVAITLGSSFPVLLFTLIPLALLIGMSRVYLGMHYPSDVIAGGVLGAISAYAAMMVL